MQAEILLLAEQASQLVVTKDGYGNIGLPSFAPPDGGRVLADVSEWCRAQLGVDIFCIFVMPEEKNIAATPSRSVFVCRTLSDSALALAEPFEWQNVESQILMPFTTEALRWIRRYDTGEAASLFARYGWLEQFCTWLACNGGIDIDRLEHHNVAPYFSLMRIQSDRNIYWFKAAGLPNHREYTVSSILDVLFPGFVPKIIARNDIWRGWLTEEIQGRNLSEESCIDSWISTFRSLAQLQIRSIEHTSILQHSGAEIWTLPRMISEAPAFFLTMGDVMKAQPKEPPNRLSSSELVELETSLIGLCFELQKLDIPDTIIHGDINPFNVIVSDGCPVFLDWAEAYIGHPFICAEFLRRYFRNQFPSDSTNLGRLESAYAEPWSDYLPAETIDRAWQIVPCLAPLLTALYLPYIDLRHVGSESRRSAFLRALVRVMKRELADLKEGDSECLR